jgi:hypothetical protein
MEILLPDGTRYRGPVSINQYATARDQMLVLHLDSHGCALRLSLTTEDVEKIINSRTKE